MAKNSVNAEIRKAFSGKTDLIIRDHLRSSQLIVHRKMKKKNDMGKPLLRKKTSMRVRIHTGEKL